MTQSALSAQNIQFITATHFLGSIELYAYYFLGEVVWEANENYQKRSIRNRCNFRSSNGILGFSIPLQKGKHEKLNIRSVKIAYDEDWVSNFKQTVMTCYQSAPYYEFYVNQIFAVVEKRHVHLWDLNRELHLKILGFLKCECTFNVSESWIMEYPKEVIDLRFQKDWDKTNYTYNQVPFGTIGFIKGLSILDLIFCAGPEAILTINHIMLQILASNNLMIEKE